MSEYPLSEYQIQFYAAKGYVRLKNMLVLHEVEELRKARAVHSEGTRLGSGDSRHQAGQPASGRCLVETNRPGSYSSATQMPL